MNMNFTWKQAETLSPGQIAIQGVELATKSWGQFVKFVLVAVAGFIAIALVTGILAAVLPAGLVGLLSFVVMVLFSLAAAVGAIRLSLAVVDGKKLTLNEIFAFDGRLVGVLILAYLLYMLAIVVGLVVLVIPGILIGIGCSYALFVIVDKKDVGPVQALKMSWAIANGDILNIALLSSAITFILYMAILPAYEIFGAAAMITAFFKGIGIATLGEIFFGLVMLVLGVVMLCAIVLVMIGGALSYALAYRKLSQTRATAMEAAMKS